MENNEYQEFNINGQVIRFYDQKGRQKHLYVAVDGDDTRQILNVTTVLAAVAKPALVQWAANEASKIGAEFAGRIAEQNYDLYADTLTAMFEEATNSVDTETDELYNKARYRYKELSQEALDIGSKVHGLIEDYIKVSMESTGGKSFLRIGLMSYACESNNEEIINSIKAFLEFDDLVEEYLECEQLCYEDPMDIFTPHEGEYIGRKDFKAKLKDGRIGWFDIKTSKDIYCENILQLLAYAVADQTDEHGFDDNEVIGVVGCGKNKELKLFIEPINKWLKYYNTFIHLLEFKRGYDQLVKDFNKAYKENK